MYRYFNIIELYCCKSKNLLESEYRLVLGSVRSSTTDLVQSLCKTVANLCSTSNRFVDLKNISKCKCENPNSQYHYFQ